MGAALAPPTAEGGRLRSQDLRTAGRSRSASAGALIRIDPATGAGVPGNPGFSSADPNERRILAYGLRNPYGLAIRPGTNDVWIADRGHGYWSELDRVPNPTDPVRNFGWPCYEGGLDDDGDPYPRIRPRSDDFDLNICENLYAEGTATTAPYWAYDHELRVVPGEDCRKNAQGAPINTSLSGLEFYPQAGGSFPAAYRGALFFSDRWRDCIWAMLPGADGLPRAGQRGEVRAACGVPARPRGRPRRRPLLRRQRDRGGEALPLRAQRLEPGAERGRAGGPACRQPAA